MGLAALIVSVLALLVALWAAVSTHQQAKTAQKQLKISLDEIEINRVIAAKAERVAVDANQLAQQANLISERILRTQSDKTVVDWEIQVNECLGEPVGVQLLSTQPVHNMVLRVSKDGDTVCEVRQEEIQPLSVVACDLQTVWDEHLRLVLAQKPTPSSSYGGLIMAGRPAPTVKLVLRFDLTYRTQAGVCCDCMLVYERSHRQKDGRVVDCM